MVGCKKFWVVSHGFGWFRVVLDGFGWFAVLIVTMNYFERSAEHAWIKKDSVKSTPSLFCLFVIIEILVV